MYLLIPLIIFGVAIVAMCYLMARKFVFLKKLTPEAISNPPATASTFWRGMFQELVELAERFNWRQHRVEFTAQSEKIVRRMRLMFLRLDTWTHNLSNRLRRSAKHHEAILEKEEEQKVAAVVEEIAKPVELDPKEEEQHLIMEIAKNPKDPLLYQRLGDIYVKTEETENALQSFETVLHLDPENWYAKNKVKSLKKKVEKPA